jgi:hypothetical protein
MKNETENEIVEQLPTFDETIKNELKKFDDVVPAIEE